VVEQNSNPEHGGDDKAHAIGTSALALPPATPRNRRTVAPSNVTAAAPAYLKLIGGDRNLQSAI